MGLSFSSRRKGSTEDITQSQLPDADESATQNAHYEVPVSVTETKSLLFYGKASPLSYAIEKSEVIPITMVILQAERQARDVIIAREQGNLDLVRNEYRKTLDSVLVRERNRGSLTDVLPIVFDYLPLLSVMPLGRVCREWRGYLGPNGINYIVYTFGAFLNKGSNRAPLQFTRRGLTEITMGVMWQESGKELGATVRVADVERVKEAQGSDISGGSTWVQYCEKFGRVEDFVSDDLEVVFPDGERRWFAMKALEGSKRERWIVRIPPGPYWIEMWVMGSIVQLVTVLKELHTPSTDSMPWTLQPVWPMKTLKCEQVALDHETFYIKAPNTGQEPWQALGPQSGITNYTVVLGKPLVPEILFGHATPQRSMTPTAKLLDTVTHIESHFIKQ